MYTSCRLCARKCGIDRTSGRAGYCKMTDKIYVARADLHMWEEPPISGTRGSGTVFFSGCSLGCIYCQNREISRGASGTQVSESRLCDIFLELRDKGAHNINLVTATHYVPSVIRAVASARGKGLDIPVVYNTGSYETPETVRALSDTVNVWLPDLKYYKPSTAGKYSYAPDLVSVARSAIDEMITLSAAPSFNDEGIMTAGVIVRILLLPGHLAEAKLNVKYLYEKYKNGIYLSLMSQYTPQADLPSPLHRRVTVAEYSELVGYAERLGVVNAFVQDKESASESYIPPFCI